MQACRNDLEDVLKDFTSSNLDNVSRGTETNTVNSNIHIEWLSFMRTIHFLIDLENNKIAKEIDEQTYKFMKCVVSVIFMVAYCYKSTKDVCHKEGNSLLSAICSSYPCLIGVRIKNLFSKFFKTILE